MNSEARGELNSPALGQGLEILMFLPGSCKRGYIPGLQRKCVRGKQRHTKKIGGGALGSDLGERIWGHLDCGIV